MLAHNVLFDDERYRKLINAWLSRNASYVECRVESAFSLSITIRDGKIKEFVSGYDSGVALRAVMGGKVYFISYSINEVSEDVVYKEKAITSRAWMEDVVLKEATPMKDKVVIDQKVPLSSKPVDEKIALLKRGNEACFNENVKTAESTYVERIVEKRLITSEGTDIYMKIPYVYIRHEVTAKLNDKINEGSARYGGIGGFEVLSEDAVVSSGELAKARAVEGLIAKKCPSGKFKVVLDGDLNHLFAHEAVGHASEADSVYIGSLLKGKLGKRVASECVNLVDDGRFELNGVKGFGWIPYDDEGVPTEKTLVIERGILKQYLTDRITAAKFDLKLTGNARAQNYQFPPIVRMRNTYIEASDAKDAMRNEEMISEVRNGLLLKGGRGGQVDDIRGTFTFGVQEVYEIKNGEVGQRLSSTSISGNFLAVLKGILAVGKEFDRPEPSVGFCGKSMQLVPVGVAGPWLLVKELLVGG